MQSYNGRIYFNSRVDYGIPGLQRHTDNIISVENTYKNHDALSQLGYTNIPHPLDDDFYYPGMKPYLHQKETVKFFTYNPRAWCLNDMGCVDSETEYLSPGGWVKISEYKGGEVAQYDPDTDTATFVEPNAYVKKPCPEMIKLKSTRGLDQMLSPEHRVLLRHYKTGSHKVVQAHELETCKDFLLREWHIPTTFKIEHDRRIDLDDDMIRLLVAVNADGHFQYKNTKWCVVRLKKERKKKRLRKLLKSAGVKYKCHPCKPDGFHIFKFYTPIYSKKFDSWWWDADGRQREIILNECKHWDGNLRNRNFSFFSNSSKDADFIQYVASTSGYTASINSQDRTGQKHYKSIEYNTHVYDRHQMKTLVGVNESGMYRNVSRAPSTDGFKYCFSVPTKFLVLRRNGCVFVSGNTGKTASALWAAEHLRQLGLLKQVMIICPVSTMDVVWANELRKCLPLCSVGTVYGSREKRLEILSQPYDYFIVNHDGIKIHQVAMAVATNPYIGLFILDEATAFKNQSTRRYKTLKDILQRRRLWALTGRPTPHSPTDAWAVSKLINPEGTKWSFSRFRDMTMVRVTQFKYVPSRGSADLVNEIMRPAIRFKKDDCLDLPKFLPTIERKVDLTKEQKKVFKQVRDDYIYAHENGEIVSAANAAVKLSKLLQICCGGVYTDEKETITLDNKNRLDALLGIINNVDSKTIIFVPFKSAQQHVMDFLKKNKETCALVNGDVSLKKRSIIFDKFQTLKSPRHLIAHPKVAAHGLTLTAADTIIWYAPTHSLEVYEQGNARIDRPGQKAKRLRTVHIGAHSIEWAIYEGLSEKSLTQQKVLRFYEQIVRGE